MLWPQWNSVNTYLQKLLKRAKDKFELLRIVFLELSELQFQSICYIGVQVILCFPLLLCCHISGDRINRN